MKVSAARTGAALVVLALGVPAVVAYGHDSSSDSAHSPAPLSNRPAATAAPARPSALRINAISTSGARVSWVPAAGTVRAAGYVVTVSGRPAIETIDPSANLTGLACGTRFQVSAVALDRSGNRSTPVKGGFATSSCLFDGTVSPPAPPSSYLPPLHGVTVSTSAQLVSALRGRVARDIVLADGTYGNSRPFRDANGSRLYARHLGGAVLTAGLIIGGNSNDGGPGGAIVQGLAFDVSNPAEISEGGEIYIAGGAGENATILDTTFAGNRVIPIGINAFNPDGLVARRLTFTHFTDEGIRASDNDTAAYGGQTPKVRSITDISVNGVSRSTPGASNGTAEAGLWIGEPVLDGVHRIKVRNVSWSGIETVNNAWNTTYTDLDIDMSGPNAATGVAVYLEHFSDHLVFDRFVLSGTPAGFNAEWNNPAWGGVAAAHDTTIENGVVNANGWTLPGRTVGIYLDQGTESTTITHVTFKNQNFAAIDAYNTIGSNKFSANKYGMGLRPISTVHI